MLYRNINLNYLFFFNYYDLINKYMYLNYYIIPKFNKISFKIFIKGFFNFKLFKKYLTNFLLLYFFCFNFSLAQFKLSKSKFKKRKKKIYKVKIFLSYVFLKKKLALTLYNIFFLLNKYVRPFFFSSQNFVFFNYSGKLAYQNYKIITFLPYTILFDYKEQSIVKFFKKSKIFLTLTLKNNLTITYYNFFISNFILKKQAIKNMILVWSLI